LLIAAIAAHPSAAQSPHERKAKELEESAPKAQAGGVTFQTSLPLAKCFDAVLNHLKRKGHDIDTANKEAGRIVTVMEIAGGYSQTGTRILVTFLPDSDTQTPIRVAVSVQKRKKLLSTEPWSDHKTDETQSASVATQLQEALKAL
jgi:hypothetical protein